MFECLECPSCFSSDLNQNNQCDKWHILGWCILLPFKRDKFKNISRKAKCYRYMDRVIREYNGEKMPKFVLLGKHCGGRLWDRWMQKVIIEGKVARNVLDLKEYVGLSSKQTAICIGDRGKSMNFSVAGMLCWFEVRVEEKYMNQVTRRVLC